MDFSKFIDRVLWGLMVWVAAYGASQIQGATTSINALNEKVAVVIAQIATQSKTVDDHEARIRSLEIKRASSGYRQGN
jgi:hypothetical protein